MFYYMRDYYICIVKIAYFVFDKQIRERNLLFRKYLRRLEARKLVTTLSLQFAQLMHT